MFTESLFTWQAPSLPLKPSFASFPLEASPEPLPTALTLHPTAWLRGGPAHRRSPVQPGDRKDGPSQSAPPDSAGVSAQPCGPQGAVGKGRPWWPRAPLCSHPTSHTVAPLFLHQAPGGRWPARTQKVWSPMPKGLPALSQLENKHFVSVVYVPASTHSGRDL